MKKYILSCFIVLAVTGCLSTRGTIQNIDNNAVMPPLNKERNFIITEVSSDKKYGYDPDYPVNLGFLPIGSATINVKRYFDALTGPQGQAITYTQKESCCPFPSRNDMGAGLLDVYEVTWEGLNEPKLIHINLYEKGKVIAPMGLGIKKTE